MKSIILKCMNEMHELEDMEVKFLFPYLVRFFENNNFKIGVSIDTSLSKKNLESLKEYFAIALNDLLADCYENPSIKRRQKHPTFYEEIVVTNKKYTVDYTTSAVGRFMYLTFIRLSFINKCLLSNNELHLQVIW